MKIYKKNILVVGLGITGLKVAEYCTAKGAKVTVTDIKPPQELRGLEILKQKGVKFELGGHRVSSFLNSDLIIISPGVPDIPEIKKAKDSHVPIVSEIEFASWFVDKNSIIAVTGTNGKSTTCSLIAEILKQDRGKVFAGGNLGRPFIEAVSSSKYKLYVVEVSSFQLEHTYSLAPRIAVLLNISKDHLDRHLSFEEYVEIKSRLFMNQTQSDYAVISARPSWLKKIVKRGKAQIYSFGSSKSEVVIKEDKIWDLRRGISFPLSCINLVGKHNLDNVMASVLVSSLLGCSAQAIYKGISSFKGLPHRMEFVAKKKGILFFNDSKATNVDAALKSIESVNSPLVLIAGGRHKGASYTPLRKPLSKRAKAIVLIGQAKDILKKELKGVADIILAKEMKEAVDIAFSKADLGDTVLLAPACSSLDMFENFEKRGECFKRAVFEIRDEKHG
jgi:UDP-N-acetylmuramoylalanine--D-glutamate ligase